MAANQINRKLQRNSCTEVLRIIAMLMIVVSHYSFHGGAISLTAGNSVNYLLLKVLTLGNLGVDVFILLFGYYSVSRETFGLQKAFLLWSQVFTYSALIFGILLLTGRIEFSVGAFVSSIMPTIFSKYWFFTSYIVFLILTPFINKMLNGFSQKNYEIYLLTMLIIWCAIPTVFGRTPSGDNFALFLMLYSIGGYFKLHPSNRFNSKKNGFYMIAISSALLLGSAVACFFLKRALPFLGGKETYFYHKNSVLIILLALGMLIVALNSKTRHNKFINLISSCTFGVYLLHDNDLLRSLIWENIFQTSTMAESPILIIHCLGSVIAVFGIGVVIELVRKNTIEKLWIGFYERLIQMRNKDNRR